MEIILRNVTVSFYNRIILNSISTYFKSEEVVLIIGPNGSGKSTLLKVLAGIVEYSGSILVSADGNDLSTLTGYVFQNPETQIIGSTVWEDVIFGLENIGLSKDEMEKRAHYVLELLELDHLRQYDPYYLSGGQKQRLAIASVLALEPEFLLLDEVTAMLDKNGKREVLMAIEKLKSIGKGIVVATHELNLYAPICDRCIFMEDGKILFEGDVKDGIRLYKESAKNQYILEKSRIERRSVNGSFEVQ
ncbi:MAG: ABC transporter ATP-binding protein [Fervidobacterium sp.]